VADFPSDKESEIASGNILPFVHGQQNGQSHRDNRLCRESLYSKSTVALNFHSPVQSQMEVKLQMAFFPRVQYIVLDYTFVSEFVLLS